MTKRPFDEALGELESSAVAYEEYVKTLIGTDRETSQSRQAAKELRATARVLRACGKLHFITLCAGADPEIEDDSEAMELIRAILAARRIEEKNHAKN